MSPRHEVSHVENVTHYRREQRGRSQHFLLEVMTVALYTLTLYVSVYLFLFLDP